MKGDDRLEQLQADHELFLQAFEKPTQIYRYLRTRNLISPIFLQRTLTFMRGRISRCNSASKRKRFKVDSLLDRKVKERSALEAALAKEDIQNVKGFMTLTFIGLYDNRRERPQERVGVEILLLKVAHKKRKDSPSNPIVQLSLGTSEVPVNPAEDHPPSKAPALAIPAEAFKVEEGHQTQTFTLVVRVHHNNYSQLMNGHSPAASSSSSATQNGEENLEPSSAKRRKLLRGNSSSFDKTLGAELVVYDKHARCPLTEGEYELVLSEVDGDSNKAKVTSPKKNSTTWETISLDKSDKTIAEQFDVFGCCPTLKFRLSWSSESPGQMVDRPRPLMPRDNSTPTTNTRSSRSGDSNRSSISQTNGRNGIKHQKRTTEKSLKIVYQFLYNNNSRQQTEAREDLHCPWCSLNCMELYALLKHLKLSHPRFLFTYVPIEEGARIDVSVSELFDSTYVGNPHDLISQPPGFAFSRCGPVQRTSVTNILVLKPKRTPMGSQQHSLSEFLESDGDLNDLNAVTGPYEGHRPFVSGHNRLYNYSTTNLPMPPHAILQPSTEDLVDPPWLITKICRMIDEFSDVNHGEKDFMKMWNMHVQHHSFVGDCQMNLALKSFIEQNGEELLAKNLYRNFVLHCCNLFEFGVLAPANVFKAITRMQTFIAERKVKDPSVRFENWSEQRDAWMKSQGVKKLEAARKDFSGIFKHENDEETSKKEEKK